ncbi:hypothetical protein McanMca71_003202, partial [Microsporum canis]
LDLRSWDRASTQEPNECGGFDYFHENDYFADCSSSPPLATLSVRSSMYSLLLDRGAELDSRGQDGQTPLSWAARNGHESIVQLLLDRGAVSASDDGTVRLWDPASGQHLQTLEGHSDPVRAVAFSPDGRMLASVSDDGTVRLWDPASGWHLQTLKGHGDPVRAVAFSPDGRILASASDDGTVRLWDSALGRHLQTLEGYGDPIRAVAFLPDGRMLISASDDGIVRLWDPASGQHLQTLEGHGDPVRAVAFSPDGRYIKTKTNKGILIVDSTGPDIGNDLNHLYDTIYYIFSIENI